MVRVGIVGATGLVGEGLIRILESHPETRLAVLTSRHAAGRDVAAELPGLRGLVSHELEPPDVGRLVEACDCVFLAMKSAESMRIAPPLLEKGVKCIDIGGEFRFRDPKTYEKWYGAPHEAPDLCARAVWGLPELAREKIASADLVANPGCYPTGAVLGALPFLKDGKDGKGGKDGLIRPDGIIVNATSGVSGAGRTYNPKSENLFLSCHENLRAYAVGTHKHTPEIELCLSEITGGDVAVTFVPHLAPIDRGILTQIYARPAGKPDAEPFLRARGSVEEVRTANVRGTNFCDVGVAVIERTSTVVVTTAIDNTVKGASGQAVQNMNIMFGLEETAGLDRAGM